MTRQGRLLGWMTGRSQRDLGTLRRRLVVAVLVIGAVMAAACGGGGPSDAGEGQALVIGAIPDQNVSEINRRLDELAAHLSQETGLEVETTQASSYASLVQAFERGEVHLAWFGGLTGVQARAAVPGSEAIAHRPRDAEFHSRFIVQADLDVEELTDLEGLSFTFGSESSTSGHLMPRYFLLEAGIDPTGDFAAEPNFSGSHDSTWQLVEGGAYQAGALNEAVWERAVSEGEVDTDSVRDFYTTPAYYDYNWTIHGDVDEMFGSGTRDSVQEALLGMGEGQEEMLALFQAEGFVETTNDNYSRIRDVAEQLDIIR